MDAFILDGVRTPIARYGGSLSGVRTDDLAALPIKALMDRNTGIVWSDLDDVVMGCGNQAGEDNRNVARMATLLAGLPETVSALTVNRLCASGMDAATIAVRAIKAGEAEIAIAGGVESMSRVPFVMAKSTSAFDRSNAVYDTTIGWRFVNPKMDAEFGTHSMPETADNVAEDWGVSCADQDAFAKRSQDKWQAAQAAGVFENELMEVILTSFRGEQIKVSHDEHPWPNTSGFCRKF